LDRFLNKALDPNLVKKRKIGRDKKSLIYFFDVLLVLNTGVSGISQVQRCIIELKSPFFQQALFKKNFSD
jgi:hypothetical protein